MSQHHLEWLLDSLILVLSEVTIHIIAICIGIPVSVLMQLLQRHQELQMSYLELMLVCHLQVRLCHTTCLRLYYVGGSAFPRSHWVEIWEWM